VILRRTIRFLDRRAGVAPFARTALRYVFPDHWSFLLGEIALYSFLVLVATGIYLTLFFEPDLSTTVYHGPYAPLDGLHVSHAYKSAVDLSFQVKAGLLMRQTHHWAADVFIVAIVLHVWRVFFTGAFRKPRELVWYVGIFMLMLALLEGYLGYSLVDDLLSGMGLAIGYSVAMSIPFVGANLALLLWGGPFPGPPAFESRMYIAHVLLFPVLIGVLLTLHIALIVARHHTQFGARGRNTDRRVVGLPAFPGYAPRTIALALAVAGVLFLLGGLVQINPIWLWGPYEVAQGTNGAQPDWYLGWLIGALRLMPGFDVTIGGHTVVPNPFWGGALFPLLVFAFLFAWPSIERRVTGDRRFHNLLDRPRDNPWRTGIGCAVMTWIAAVFLAGSADRLYASFGIPYEPQIWFWRVVALGGPFVAFYLARRLCTDLARDDERRVRTVGFEPSD
jgi:ubiquinol-cytochrome c reductase cytochrome b subunit